MLVSPILLAVILALSPASRAVKTDPIVWSVDAPSEFRPGKGGHLVLRARIERGWYIYGLRQPANGPAPLRFRMIGGGFTLGSVDGPRPTFVFDEGFRARVTKHAGASMFRLPVLAARSLAAGSYTVRIETRYQACNDSTCLPPRTVVLQARIPVRRR